MILAILRRITEMGEGSFPPGTATPESAAGSTVLSEKQGSITSTEAMNTEPIATDVAASRGEPEAMETEGGGGEVAEAPAGGMGSSAKACFACLSGQDSQTFKQGECLDLWRAWHQRLQGRCDVVETVI